MNTVTPRRQVLALVH